MIIKIDARKEILESIEFLSLTDFEILEIKDSSIIAFFRVDDYNVFKDAVYKIFDELTINIRTIKDSKYVRQAESLKKDVRRCNFKHPESENNRVGWAYEISKDVYRVKSLYKTVDVKKVNLVFFGKPEKKHVWW